MSKLRFGSSDVLVGNHPALLEKLRQCFRAANQHGISLLIHMCGSLRKLHVTEAQLAQTAAKVAPYQQ